MRSKPDGYAVDGVDMLATGLNYAQPERGTTFAHKSFSSITSLDGETATWIVSLNSPYKSVKDIVHAAKAYKKISFATTGALGPFHLAGLNIGRVAGFKFDSTIHYDQFPKLISTLLAVATLTWPQPARRSSCPRSSPDRRGYLGL